MVDLPRADCPDIKSNDVTNPWLFVQFSSPVEESVTKYVSQNSSVLKFIRLFTFLDTLFLIRWPSTLDRYRRDVACNNKSNRGK